MLRAHAGTSCGAGVSLGRAHDSQLPVLGTSRPSFIRTSRIDAPWNMSGLSLIVCFRCFATLADTSRGPYWNQEPCFLNDLVLQQRGRECRPRREIPRPKHDIELALLEWEAPTLVLDYLYLCSIADLFISFLDGGRRERISIRILTSRNLSAAAAQSLCLRDWPKHDSDLFHGSD